MNMKKWIAAALALLRAGTLPACGSQSRRFPVSPKADKGAASPPTPNSPLPRSLDSAGNVEGFDVDLMNRDGKSRRIQSRIQTPASGQPLPRLKTAIRDIVISGS